MNKKQFSTIALLILLSFQSFSQSTSSFLIRNVKNSRDVKEFYVGDNIGVTYKIKRPEIPVSEITAVEKNSLVIQNQNILFDEIKLIKYSNVSKKSIIAGSIMAGIGTLMAGLASLVVLDANSSSDPEIRSVAPIFIPPIIIFGGMAIAGGALIINGVNGSNNTFDMEKEWKFEK